MVNTTPVARASLAPFFGELAGRSLFVVFELRPKASGIGTDKIPIGPYTQPTPWQPVNAHDEGSRMTLAEAELYVSQLTPSAPVIAYGIGYVLTEGVNTFFLDLDHCRAGDGWASYVADVLAAFPGAYIEVSSSGDGIHVIGTYSGPRPLHGTRCAELRAELYTAGRFCALTGLAASGAVAVDASAGLVALLPRFPGHDYGSAEWTTGPVPEWSGPADDDELLARAVRSQSAGSVFGSKVSFADLWAANPDKLGPAFPPQTAGQTHDGSAADLALANHLAFWTGNDCERMARLLRRSGLARDKHGREDYMRSTVLRACADQRAWYSERPRPGDGPPTAGVPLPVPADGTPGVAVVPPLTDYTRARLPADDFVSVLSHGSYLFRPTRDLWPKKSVEIACGPSMPEVIDQNSPVHQMIWAPGNPEYIRDLLLIEGGWITKPNVGAYNIYREPPTITGDASNVQPWLDLVTRVYPDCAGHFVRWLAYKVQHPGEKINHALVMGGGSGIGKDTILEPLKLAVGAWNMTEVSPEVLFGRFNGYVKSIILRVSEVRSNEVTAYDLYERTKTLIAAPPDVHRVDEKNIAEHAVMNVVGVILTTNHLTNGIYLPPEDRRHFMMWSPAKKADMQPLCSALWAWYKLGGLANVAMYLRTVDVSDFDPKAEPPKTSAWHTVVSGGRNDESDEFAGALESLGSPAVVSVPQIYGALPEGSFARVMMLNPGQRRAVVHRIADCGYARYSNASVADGRWRLGAEKVVLYRRNDASDADVHAALIAMLPP